MASGQIYTTDNFIVKGRTESESKYVAHIAEAYKAQTYRKWFGKEHVQWKRKCKIFIYDQTSFGYSHFQPAPFAIVLKKGPESPYDNIYMDILPHELNHAVFSEEVGINEIPLWLLEGIAMTEETDRAKSYYLGKASEVYVSPREKDMFLSMEPRIGEQAVGLFYALSYEKTRNLLKRVPALEVGTKIKESVQSNDWAWTKEK
jgi:hypothetical protein